jgi:diacylglycerol O-acyltransferase
MERMGSLDAVFLAIESSASPMNFGSVGIFEGPAPAVETVQAFISLRLQLVPRCRQRVRPTWRNLARPVWIDDVKFDIRDHVHAASISAEQPFALERFVEQVMVDRLDRGRALWEMWVVDGLTGDRWAIVSKVHHCLVDGIAGTDLLSVLMDVAPNAEQPTAAAWTPDHEPSPIEVARSAAGGVARSVWTRALRLLNMLVRPRSTWLHLRNLVIGARGLWLTPSRRDSPLTGPIGSHRRWMHTKISLHDVATVRRAFGGTVNDVVLTAIACGFRDLLQSRGEMCDRRTVMALVPVSMRAAKEHGYLDNRVAVTHALLPVGIEDPVATLAAVREHLDSVKGSHETDASTVLLHSGDFVPYPVASVVARSVVRMQRNLETIATNVPGPQHPMYLCGRQMLEAYPFAPIAGHIRIGIAIWSYCGYLYFGVTGDRDGMTDLDRLVLGISHGFEGLLGAATP